MTESNVNKVIKWLDTQIEANQNRELVINSENFSVRNLTPYPDRVHINANVPYIAELLDLEVLSEVFTVPDRDGEYEKVWFMYKSTQFFTVYEKEN